MNVKWFLAFGLVAVIAQTGALGAQGFAGLGRQAEGFAQVTPGRSIVFPKDFASHDDFRIEWWYVTAVLETPEGEMIGVQWTLFRRRMTPPRPGEAATGWDTPHLWMAHAAITTKEAHYDVERFARGGVGQAGVDEAPSFVAWIDEWSLAQSDPTVPLIASPLTVNAGGEDFAYALALTPQAPPMLQGVNGFSVKAASGQASYYFSQPFLSVEGQVEIEGRVLSVAGKAWLDREWSSQPLSGGQEGWDWFSIHLQTGQKLMVFQLRDREAAPFYSGLLFDAAGGRHVLSGDQIRMKPLKYTRRKGRRAPTQWSLEIPDHDLLLTVRALNPDSFMQTVIPYWEGPILVDGGVPGVGFLEMTGY